MTYLGDFPDDASVYFRWNTNAIAGESITRATDGTISVYKDDDGTQTTTGVTDTENADGLTGVHLCKIATTDAFYATGTEYQVVLSAASIDGKTINAVLAHFSIERAGGALALLKGANGLAAIKTQTAAIETDTQDLQTQVGAAGAGLTAINLPDQTMNITGNITGNLSGSVGSVTGLTASDVGAVKAKTDSLNFTVAGVVNANVKNINDVAITGDGSGTPFQV